MQEWNAVWRRAGVLGPGKSAIRSLVGRLGWGQRRLGSCVPVFLLGFKNEVRAASRVGVRDEA